MRGLGLGLTLNLLTDGSGVLVAAGALDFSSSTNSGLIAAVLLGF